MDNPFEIAKIKLIVGLGNLGTKFEKTRHNIGFMFIDLISENKLKEEPKFKGFVEELTIDGNKTLLLKPTTMMNLSGESVSLISNFYKIKPQEILVAYDDLDLIFGNVKLQLAKGPKIHNGLLSIEQHLNSKNFWRLRIGVDGRTPELRKRIAPNEYVLNRFSKEEEKKLTQILNNAKALILNETN